MQRRCDYLRLTGRDEKHMFSTVEAYLKAQGIFGIPRLGEVEYSDVLEVDLSDNRTEYRWDRSDRKTVSRCRMSKQTFNETPHTPCKWDDGFGVTEKHRE